MFQPRYLRIDEEEEMLSKERLFLVRRLLIIVFLLIFILPLFTNITTQIIITVPIISYYLNGIIGRILQKE